MKPFPHSYRVYMTGRASGYADLMTGNLRPLRTAPPPQFDGPGDAWSPEDLFLAAIESCFLFTVQAVARQARLDFIDLDLDVEGTVDRRSGTTRFTEIVLRAVLSVPAGIDHVRARAVLEKTEHACLVSASIATPIRLEAQVVDARPEVLRPSA